MLCMVYLQLIMLPGGTRIIRMIYRTFPRLDRYFTMQILHSPSERQARM